MTIFEKYYKASAIEFVRYPDEIVYAIISNSVSKKSIMLKLFPKRLDVIMHLERLKK